MGRNELCIALRQCCCRLRGAPTAPQVVDASGSVSDRMAGCKTASPKPMCTASGGMRMPVLASWLLPGTDRKVCGGYGHARSRTHLVCWLSGCWSWGLAWLGHSFFLCRSTIYDFRDKEKEKYAAGVKHKRMQDHTLAALNSLNSEASQKGDCVTCR